MSSMCLHECISGILFAWLLPSINLIIYEDDDCELLVVIIILIILKMTAFVTCAKEVMFCLYQFVSQQDHSKNC